MENKQLDMMLKGAFGRKRSRLAFDLSLSDIAYMAGLIDGEGSILVTHSGPGIGAYQLRLQVANTDYRVMLWMQTKFGAHINKGGMRQKDHHKQAWYALWYSSYAKEVIRLIEPYLIIKKEQALLALQFPTDKSRVPEQRYQMYLAFRELNKTGL